MPFTPREDSWYSFLLEAELTPGPYCGWKDRSIEKSNDLIGNRTSDLLACSIVPQPTTLPRATQGWHTVNLTCQVMELAVSASEVSFTYDNLIMKKLEDV
jgi:hypothetical protein